jgi:PPOX class F420-dependent enzyme/OxyR family protein
MPFMFTDAEIAYITSQPLGRLATVGPDGRPHVMPVGVFYDPEAEAVVIGGHNLAASRRFRDARRGSASVPGRILAWGIDTGSFELTARDVA